MVGGSDGLCWKTGTKVEVTTIEEGFTGAWYEATIVKPPWKSPTSNKSIKALVQYQTLVSDGGSKPKPLKEYFHERFMRPIPPPSSASGETTRRESFELNDVVDAFYQDGWWTGVVTQVLPGSGYTVTFQNPPDQLDLDASSLRLHLDWLNGQWVRPQKLETMQNEIGVGNQTVDSIKRRGRPPNLHVRSLPTSVAGMKIKARGDHEQQNVGKECVMKETKASAVLRMKSKRTNKSRGKTTRPLLSEEVIPATEHPEQPSHSCNTANNPTKAIQLESSVCDTAKDKTEERIISPTNSGKNQTEQTTPCHQIVSPAGILTNKKLKQATPGSDATTSRPSKRPKKGDKTEFNEGEKIEISQGKECGMTSQTKRRGRPPKLRYENQRSSVTSSQDASIGKIAGVYEIDCGREKPKIAITKISYDVAGDHQPLHMCSEGINSSTKLDDSRFSSDGTVNQWNEARESEVEVALIDCMDNSVSHSNQKLPFVKSSRIWETVYAMEVFKKMQQNPHFCPLYNFKEEFREGLAIAATVTFANLVEKTCKMQLDDPRSIWVNYLEVLLDLETHGFDVQVLRNRLNELLAIKDRHEQNLEELNQREIRLLEEVNKNCKIDEEIDKLNEKIREFKEKRAAAMSIKKIQDFEIATLQQRADGTREGIRSTKLDFERVSTLPLLTGL